MVALLNVILRAPNDLLEPDELHAEPNIPVTATLTASATAAPVRAPADTAPERCT